MNSEIHFDGNRLVIGETTHKLDHRVIDCVVVGETVVVLIHPREGEAVEPRNILGFDLEGNRQWKVHAPASDRGRHMFHSIAQKDGELFAQSWDKHRYKIEPDTGAIEDLGRTRK